MRETLGLNGNNHVFAHDDGAFKPGIRDWHSYKPEVEGAIEDPFELDPAAEVLHFEIDIGAGFSEQNDGAGEQISDRGNAASNAKAVEIALHGLLCETLQGSRVNHQRSCAISENFSRRGKDHTTGCSLEESSPDVRFEAFDLFCQCRLRDMEPERCPPEVQFLSENDEGP
jgi:hypothetical protein